MATPCILEEAVRFSKSKIWQYQEDYFKKQGITAWEKVEVPYYVTSNAVIAHGYAQIVLRYFQDTLRLNYLDPNEPIYLFELGTGSGKFSFLFLTHLTRLLKHYGLDHLKFTYVMTDFTEVNMRYWQKHPQFQEFLEKKLLDFAIFRVGETESVTLVNQGITIGEGSCKNPVFVVANYLFDTVPCDAFYVENGRISEGLLSLETDQSNIDGFGIKSLDHLETKFTFKEIRLPYYNDPALDMILECYREHLHDSTILIPTGGIGAIETFRRFSNDRLLLISGDKGYTSLEAIDNLSTPHIAFHGSFSMMVNFDAVARYFENIGGDHLLTPEFAGMKNSTFVLGLKMSDLPETAWAQSEYNDHFSTKEFLYVKNNVLEIVDKLDMSQVLSLLKMSYWDPDIFFSVCKRMAALLERGANDVTKSYLRFGFKEIYKNYYFVKNNKNILFELAHMYHLIGDASQAVPLYEASLEKFGRDSATLFNLALCYHAAGKPQQAITLFQEVLTLNPESEQAKEWIEKIRQGLLF